MRTLRGQLVLGTAALLVVSGAAARRSPNPAMPVQATTDAAARLVAAARGANPILCELAVGAVDQRYGSWYGGAYPPDADAEVRDLLEQAFRDSREAGAVPTLRDALSDSDPCVRRVAARLLGRLRHPSATEALREALRQSRSETREMGAIGLGVAETRDALEPLVQALRDESAHVRAAAAWALGEIEDSRAVGPLTRALSEDADPAVRRQAARALGRLH